MAAAVNRAGVTTGAAGRPAAVAIGVAGSPAGAVDAAGAEVSDVDVKTVFLHRPGGVEPYPDQPCLTAHGPRTPRGIPKNWSKPSAPHCSASRR